MNPNDISMVAAITAIMSTLAAIFSAFTAHSTRKSTKRGQLQAWLLRYLDAHNELLRESKDIFRWEVYSKATGDLRNRAQIVGGLLVIAVELMKEAGDGRYKVWKDFPRGLEGPLLDDQKFDLSVYAASSQMKRNIARWREEARVECKARLGYAPK